MPETRHRVDQPAPVDRRPTHQLPGADPTAIQEGDRITLLTHGWERALLVTSTRPARDGAVYVAGRHVNARGRPAARAGEGLYLSGPAGGDWDWYTHRKPHTPPVTGRRRLVVAAGDGQPLYRRARTCDATATIYIAPEGAPRVEQLAHPAVSLTVACDATWTVSVHTPAGDGASRSEVVVATGTLDRPANAAGAECEVCGRNDLVQSDPPRCSRHKTTGEQDPHAASDGELPAPPVPVGTDRR